jgi:hypothetical protein
MDRCVIILAFMFGLWLASCLIAWQLIGVELGDVDLAQPVNGDGYARDQLGLLDVRKLRNGEWCRALEPLNQVVIVRRENVARFGRRKERGAETAHSARSRCERASKSSDCSSSALRASVEVANPSSDRSKQCRRLIALTFLEWVNRREAINRALTVSTLTNRCLIRLRRKRQNATSRRTNETHTADDHKNINSQKTSRVSQASGESVEGVACAADCDVMQWAELASSSGAASVRRT